MLDLRPGDGSGSLEVNLTARIPAEDFDALLYDAHGRQVWFVGEAGTILENGTTPELSAGVYYLVVQPFTSRQGAPFEIMATLR